MDNTQTITRFVIDEFLPDVRADQLAPDYDLLDNGVIDSLGLLKVIAWLEDRFALAVDELDLDPDSFRTVAAINTFVRNATTAVGAS
jgi:acyl carrier protein